MTEEQDIVGLDLSGDACDFIWQKTSFKKEWHAFEVPLFTSKWFDYRFMHPVKATYLFAHHYRQVYRRLFAENFDEARAEFVKGFRGEDLFRDAPAVIVSSMWRARQHADAIGCPYEVYISAAANKLLRLNRANMPYISEFYQGWVLDAVQQAWSEMQSGRLFVAKHSAFQAQNYRGLKVQDEHHDWLFEQARKRDSIARWLNRFIWTDGLIPEDRAETRFGRDMIESARAYS